MTSAQPEALFAEFEPAKIDWDFDNVPKDELAACCLWEYGRESPSFLISDCDKVRDVRGESALFKKYEAFLDAYWNSDEGYMVFYETIRLYGGPTARPWQIIPEEIRKRLTKQVGVHEVSWPCAPGMRRQLEELWKANLAEWEPVRKEPGYDPDEDMMAYEESHPRICQPGHAGETRGEILAAFAIDFWKFNDKQICADFAAWLKANRPQDCPERTMRGKKQRDLRVALERLGMIRLLHHFTLKEVAKYHPEAAKAFAGYDWYKERKRAGKTFTRLFPFLPKSERPLSWPTRGGRGRQAGNHS
jgi:hypothetical protein